VLNGEPRRPVVSVVVPVYFNEGSLEPLFGELVEVEAALGERGAGLELIFVDDGSGDRSLEVLHTLRQRRHETKVIKLTRNFGAVHASKTGLRYATGDCALILAADQQDPPELILRTFDEWRKGARFVVCARESREDPFLQRAWAWLYYRIIRTFVIKDYPMGGFDVALMDRAILPYLLSSAKNTNTPLFAFWLGFPPVLLSYKRRRRSHGRSRWTFWKRIEFFLDSILGFSIIPVRTISVVGAFVSLVSFSYGVSISIAALRGRVPVPGFAATASLLSFLLGLVILMLGIVAEYLWRIYSETSRLPETIVEREWGCGS
jgi:glycosyltransferase involved in cell wall biosynthesis